MTTEIIEQGVENAVITYSVSDAAIEQLGSRLTGLTANTTANYKLVREGIAECRNLRVAVEKTRKQLKASSLEYGRKVDAEAKRITKLLEGIEEPLKLERQKADDEKARIKKEKEEAARKKMEEELAAKRKAEEERVKAEQEAERQKLEAERKKIEAERAAEAAKQKELQEQLAKQQAEIEAERAKLAAEKEAIEAAKREEEAKQRAEQEARERKEREVAEAKAAAERAEEEARILASMRPDVDKLRQFVFEFESAVLPALATDRAQTVLGRFMNNLHENCEAVRTWCDKNQQKEDSTSAAQTV